jgi:transposase
MGKSGFTHHSPITKYKIQGTIDFLRGQELLGQGRLFTHQQVFEHFNVSRTCGYRILNEPREVEPVAFSSKKSPDPRGRKKKLDHQALVQIERCIDQGVFDRRTQVPWNDVTSAAGLDVEVSGRTVRRFVRELNYRRCISCDEEYRSTSSKEKRAEHARVMLEKYPEPRDWYRVRFSGDCHFGWGPTGEVSALRQPWERYCADCMVETKGGGEDSLRKLHCWAAVGHDFKSDLVWYDKPSESNGKLDLPAYRDNILEPVVGPWLRAGHNFVLAEDVDSGHSGRKGNNIVQKWKQENGLQSFFNCPLSPDFVPIERAFQLPRQYVKHRACWEDSSVKELAEEGWGALRQETINRWVDQIPQTLKTCLEKEGA